MSQPLVYLFNDAILFIGRVPIGELHATPVNSLVASLQERISFQAAGENSDIVRCIYLPGGAKRKLIGSDDLLLSCLTFPKYLRIARRVEQKMRHNWSTAGGIYDMDGESEWIRIMEYLYLNRPEAGSAYGAIRNFYGAGESLFEPEYETMDIRVREAIRLIKQQVANEQKSDIAGQLGVSSQHLRRLFKQSVGVGLAKYTTHVRMMSLVILRNDGLSVTEAIAGAGFYDASHCDKRHRESYGISPSYTLSVCDTRVHADVSLQHLFERRKQQTGLDRVLT